MDANDVHVGQGIDELRRCFDAELRPQIQVRNQHEPPSSEPVRKLPQLALSTAAELLKEALSPVHYIVPDYIAEGVTLLAGKGKIGKSWLVLDLAIAVATGGYALGSIAVEEGDVLYLALEDNKRRLQARLKQLRPTDRTLERLYYGLACPRFDAGGLDEIRGWSKRVPRPRLIIIDVLGKIRPSMKRGESIYDYDYRSVAPLQELAAELGLAVIIVHHTNKATHDDPFDTVSGSTGLPGAADSVLILASKGQGTTLYGRGRDIETFEVALTFDQTTGHWSILGAASEVRRSDERSLILKVLKEAGEAMKPNDIAEAAGMKRGNVRRLLPKMAEAGEVKKPKYGWYEHPGNSGNSGNTSYCEARDGEPNE